MDEYIGLPADHPQSFHYYMNKNLFKRIDIDPKNIHIPDGMTEDTEKECKLYEEAIRAEGGIDLFLGGMGSDGHIAFNEPGSSLSSRTRVKTLNSLTKTDNARFFGGDTSKVPDTALTVGVGTIMDSREVLIIVSGRSKARALAAVVEEGINHMWTLSCLQMHPKAIIAEGGIDLFLGGMGNDGHIAFNEPGSSLSSRTRVKTLNSQTKAANARFFGGDTTKVPGTALTVGVGTIMDSREVLIIVSGQSKARALSAVVEGGINHMWTLSCLQMHPKAIIVCDEEAASELKAGTISYFKDIERL
jgi:6-phosphogluconolactonase/glucosamine-6-phosphate isomerase/deaminase